jgi:transposase-like protein
MASKETKHYRKYPPELKWRAVTLKEQGRTNKFIAKELSVPEATIRSWVDKRKAKKERAPLESILVHEELRHRIAVQMFLKAVDKISEKVDDASLEELSHLIVSLSRVAQPVIPAHIEIRSNPTDYDISPEDYLKELDKAMTERARLLPEVKREAKRAKKRIQEQSKKRGGKEVSVELDPAIRNVNPGELSEVELNALIKKLKK